ncbi:helix-turn-helix domain-containing protein [Burkholderia singularis]|uniref:helix-turn-helix domain-containing protein n=1 Tax=Burkholderia singularis TaxID=1503053 RepID=UPI0009E76655|nr:helix-turn-helix domain-containing protein [Burkholderia singularis]
MFSILYFPLLNIQSIRSWSIPTDHIVDMLLDGQILTASRVLHRCSEEGGSGTHASRVLQLVADLQVCLGMEVEAEENYQRSQHMIRSSKRELRVTSCRNAAWQALYRYRPSTALSCFARIIAWTEDIGLEQELEARFGMICALYAMGRVDEVAEALGVLEERIHESPEVDELWKALIEAMRFDITVQIEMHCSNALSDHAYWRSGLDSVDGQWMQRKVPSVSPNVLRARIEYVQKLREMMSGVYSAASSANVHLCWACKLGMQNYQRTVRLEIAMAGLIGSVPQIAEAVLEPLHRDGQRELTAHARLDYLYCTAKTEQARGHIEKAWQWYSRYTLTAMQCLRENSRLAPLPNRATKLRTPADDIDARLPVRYRRAYHFIIDNLNRSDLSICEIAAEINLTERALQWAFRKYLGLSPTELIRDMRMERIREELLSEPTRNVLEVARRWGVRNCTTLLNGYRKQFHEAPSQTLAP